VTGNRSDWAVIGGGILGLTLALRLAQKGQTVTVYEGADTIGGLVSTVKLADVTWDRFYHVTLLSDSALLGLLRELDLEDHMEWVPTGTGLYAKGRLYPVSSAFDYLRLPVIGPISKVRIAATVLRASRLDDWKALEQVSAKAWLTKWSGGAAYDSFWEPLLRSKLGDRHEEASAAFIWAIMQRLYAARRAGIKQDLFGYLPGGYGRIMSQMEHALTEVGVEIRTGTSVESVHSAESGVEVVSSTGTDVFEGVVVTTPSPIATRLVPQLTEAQRQAHDAVVYQGVVCVTLLMSQPLGGYYVTNITDPSFPFTGVIEMTAVVDPAHMGGRTLVHLPKYVAPDDDLFDMPDDEIRSGFIGALCKMYPSITDESIEAAVVSRARHVMPLSTIGYSSNLPPMTTSVDGVHIVNTAHIVNGTLNVDETIQLADRASSELLSSSAHKVVK